MQYVHVVACMNHEDVLDYACACVLDNWSLMVFMTKLLTWWNMSLKKVLIILREATKIKINTCMSNTRIYAYKNHGARNVPIISYDS